MNGAAAATSTTRAHACTDFHTIVDDAKEYILAESCERTADDLSPRPPSAAMAERQNAVRTAIRSARSSTNACMGTATTTATAASDEELQEANMVVMAYDYVASNSSDDENPLHRLATSIAESLRFLNRRKSMMNLILDDNHIEEHWLSDVFSIFQLPYALSRACSRSEQQQQNKKRRRLLAPPPSWKICYAYVLCRLAVDHLSRLPFAFTLDEWKRRVQALMDRQLWNSRAAGAAVALFQLDWYLDLHRRQAAIPAGLSLQTPLADLIGPRY